ncbi:dirigent protein 21-like [Dorcoceras hygrometricum]|uniref:Dirigent protein n=1 Tax=Dorcoceras hygrometricum TaxID=472368 RepID=A0A2Z7BP45_9LAMI|nr:dirigent protein 21-like [Dorcoceras hygrometricum]
MANLTLVILMLVSTTMGSYARKQGPNGELEWFQNICSGKEKVAKVHFFVQDVLGGDKPTVYEVARGSITSNSATSFGQVRVLDDLLTVGPDKDSKELGRAQGLITSADFETDALAMNLNFVFTSGRYNGSTISILGRNQILKAERELAVVGGTGVFRMARGYAITKTHSYDSATAYGVLEYTIYVTYVEDPTSSLLASE